MKKVYIVSKTHLDLGFTDFSQNVLEKYINEYIPNATKTANEVNTDTQKRFVWTTGSWLLLKALEQDSNGDVKKALQNGNIAPHAMPFTIHTELLDKGSLDYALGLVDRLDKITGTKTVAAKMTDVPGHTISLVPILAKHGIKLLHIGVNGASAMPDVPECFLWKHEETNSEVIVIYSGSYGGEFKSELVDEILYFDHTVDNRGARNKEDTIKAFEKVEALYPDYEVEAGRMDDFANALWEQKDKLPIITNEIGDTWIHGIGTDPFKVGALKEIISLKNKAIENGTLDINSKEYESIMDAILCTAEHTWGGDSKIFLSDYSYPSAKVFNIVRASGKIPAMSNEVKASIYGRDIIAKRENGEYREGSYENIEATWAEQRQYVKNAINVLNNFCNTDNIMSLIPDDITPIESNNQYRLQDGDIAIIASDDGAVDIEYKGNPITQSNDRVPIRFMSFSPDDYDMWLLNYTRDFMDNHIWSWADFCRPFYHTCDGQMEFGEYDMECSAIAVQNDTLKISFTADEYQYTKFGCPKNVQLWYKIEDNKVNVTVLWSDRLKSRIPQATFFRLYPKNTSSLEVTKCGYKVDTKSTVKNGNRRLFACENIATKDMTITNHHSPLCIAGFCNLVRFSNDYPSLEDGISFVLHNNIWGTNFPLWYGDNAKFEFTVELGE